MRHAGAIVADGLDADRAVVLDSYRQRLIGTGSAIAADPRSLAQAVAQAGHVLDDVIASVRAGQVRVSESALDLSMRIGSARAGGSVHPIESLRAASELFDVVLRAVTTAATKTAATKTTPTNSTPTARPGADPDAGALSAVAVAAQTLHSSIMTRIRWASGSYVSFLLDRVHRAQVEERRRIARELHDRVGSTAAVVSRNLELADAYATSDPRRSRDKADIAYRASLQTLEDIRQVAADMRLDGGIDNLEKALRSFIDVMTDGDSVMVDLTVSGDEGWVPAAILDEVFAGVREALRNAFVHASPSAILAQIDIAPHEICARVSDNGSGFDPTSPRAAGEGIASMRERMDMLGGRIFVSSAAGEGAQVEIIIPLAGAVR